MGLFGNKTKRLVEQFRQKSEYYSNELQRDIRDYHEELKSAYQPNRAVVEEFGTFVKDLEKRISNEDARRLDDFLKRISRVDRSARNGIEAMWELSNYQRKNTAQNLRELDHMA